MIQFIINDDFPTGKLYVEITEDVITKYSPPFTFNCYNIITENLIWSTDNMFLGFWSEFLDVQNCKAFLKDANGQTVDNFTYDVKLHGDYISKTFLNWCEENKGAKGLVVGTNDGSSGEWTYPTIYGLVNSTLVEASEKQFLELEKNYKKYNNVNCILSLITPQGGDVDFFECLDGLGTVNSVIKEHTLNYTDKIVANRKKSISINDIILNTGLGDELKWLHLDVEGIDDQLILSLDIKNIKLPEIIIFENVNLSKEKKDNLNIWFDKNNYQVKECGWNSMAIKKSKPDFCIIVFSHADTIEKEQILYESVLSLKILNLSIILASHIPVSERIQSLCNYFVKDDNNLILSESEILSNPGDIVDDLYTIIDIYGGLKFETSLFKKTYQPAVLNLFISAFNFAKSIGFNNAIVWEYDYVLGSESIKFIQDSIDLFIKKNLNSISFTSKIDLYNNDISYRTIECCHAIPVFYNIKNVVNSLPSKFIENSLEFVELTNLMIVEQWVKSKIINKSKNKIEYLYGDFFNFMPDTKLGMIHSQRDNYLLSGLRSGIYINYENGSACCLFSNVSSSNLKVNITISTLKNDVIWNVEIDLFSRLWSYRFLSDEIYKSFNTTDGLKVIELVEDLQTNKIDKFEYIINKNNLEFISKLKKFVSN